MPIAISPEQRALQASIREWANQAGTIALVRQLEPGRVPRVVPGAGVPGELGEPAQAGDWAEYWEALAGLGIFSIALPAAVGGADGTVADLAAALEELTHALAPGPVMPTLLAGLLLRGRADHPAVKELLPALASGQASAAVGLVTGTLTGTWLADGALRVSGETGPVLGVGATSHLLLGAATENAEDNEAWFLIPAGREGIEVAPAQPVDFSRSLARIRLTSAIIAPDDILTGLTTAAVRDLAATLFCAEAAAVAGFCSGTAAAYARTRHQFGRPIGSFQAVKHLCAGMLCRAESASAAAWDAARAADEAMDLWSAMAQLAGADEGHRAAVRKLVGVAHRQAVAETALTLCGPDGAASDGPAADAVYGFLLSRCLSIAGGTSQILLNVVAERALGLPREEAR